MRGQLTSEKFDVLAYRRGYSTEIPDGNPLDPERYKSLQILGNGTLNVLVKGMYAAYNLDFGGVSNIGYHSEAQELMAQLSDRGHLVATIRYPRGSSPETISSIQEGLRVGTAALKYECQLIAPGTGQEHIDQAAGALYLPPPEVQIGEPWVPDELQALLR